MKHKLLAVLLMLGALFIAPGCGPAPLPTCTVSQLQKPHLLYPGMWETVSSLQPTLTWTYPEGPYGEYPSPYYYGADACLPQNYRVTLRTGPYFTDDLGGETPNATGVFTTPVLQPGTEYAWAVRPLVGGVSGPGAGYRYFFTGPICADAALVAPVLLTPANGATISDNWPTLIWDYPQDCTPRGYRVDLSTTADFSDTSLSGGTGNPSTRWAAGHPLDNCRTYYWKVTPLNGTAVGPASATFRFRIQMGGTACLFEWPLFKVLKNAACRFGPGLDYNIMDYLTAGEERQAEGRNEDASWLLLRLDANRLCWIARNLGEMGEDPMLLPLAEYPPRPLPGPTDTPKPSLQPYCSQFTTRDACLAQAQYGCKWNDKTKHCDGP